MTSALRPEHHTPDGVTVSQPRVRDRTIRLFSGKVSNAEDLPGEWDRSGSRTFRPNHIRVNFSRDTLHSEGPWDVAVVVSGPNVKADGETGLRTVTRTYVLDAEDTREPAWPAWVRDVVASAHPSVLATAPQ